MIQNHYEVLNKMTGIHILLIFAGIETISHFISKFIISPILSIIFGIIKVILIGILIWG